MKVTIIGTGYVGLVTGTCLAELGNDVICIDNNQKKIDLLNNKKSPIYEPGLEALIAKNFDAGRMTFTSDLEKGVRESQVIFIAVSTPSRPDGGADLSYVENVAREIAIYMDEYKVIIDKSTVPVNTGEKVAQTLSKYGRQGVPFDVVSNPEFLREGSAIKDTMEPDRIVIGLSSSKAEAILKELYGPLNAPIIVTNMKSAEIIKHASNSFLAMKISFINAVSQICESSGADVSEVALGMGLDKRIGQAFLCAGMGYGGSCFPKDVSAFVKIAEKMGYDFNLLKAVEEVNREQTLFFQKKIEEALWVIKNKKIALWGLAFKPNTDDMRSAPAVGVIKTLQEEGADLIAYDPVAMENAKIQLPDLNMGESALSVLKGVDALIIFTEWLEFQEVDLNQVKALMGHPLIIDARNIFEPKSMKEKGFEYHSVGRLTH